MGILGFGDFGRDMRVGRGGEVGGELKNHWEEEERAPSLNFDKKRKKEKKKKKKKKKKKRRALASSRGGFLRGKETNKRPSPLKEKRSPSGFVVGPFGRRERGRGSGANELRIKTPKGGCVQVRKTLEDAAESRPHNGGEKHPEEEGGKTFISYLGYNGGRRGRLKKTQL